MILEISTMTKISLIVHVHCLHLRTLYTHMNSNQIYIPGSGYNQINIPGSSDKQVSFDTQTCAFAYIPSISDCRPFS